MKEPLPDLINLTPHPVDLILPDGRTHRLPASGTVLRVVEDLRDLGTIMGLPVQSKGLRGLATPAPPPVPGRWYVVSSIVAQAAGREDFLIPSPVRDEAGRIIGAKGFFVIKGERR